MVEGCKMKAQESHRSINDWGKIFENVYGQADSKRTPEQMWTAVMAHASSIGESIRKGAFESLLNSAVHHFCWLCSFVNKCNGLDNDDIFSIKDSLCGIVSLKYPCKCGYCRKNPCACDPVVMEGERNKSAEYKKLLEFRKLYLDSFEGYSVKDACEVFREIYSGRIHIQTLDDIGFHFLEEIGEAAFCVRKLSQLRTMADVSDTGIDRAFLGQLSSVEGIVENYAIHGPSKRTKIANIDYASTKPKMLKARVVEAKMGLVVEIGDSFSWFCSILNKLDSILRSIYNRPEKYNTIKMPFEEVLIKEYFDPDGNARCPHCKSSICKCVFYL